MGVGESKAAQKAAAELLDQVSSADLVSPAYQVSSSDQVSSAGGGAGAAKAEGDVVVGQVGALGNPWRVARDVGVEQRDMRDFASQEVGLLGGASHDLQQHAPKQISVSSVPLGSEKLV